VGICLQNDVSVADGSLQPVSHELNLSRHFERRIYYGKPVVALIVQNLMQDADSPARDANEETLLKILFTFYTTVRPSTLGAANSEVAELGRVNYSKISRISMLMPVLQFLKLKHLTIQNEGRGTISVRIRFEEYKVCTCSDLISVLNSLLEQGNLWTATGTSQEFALEHVTEAHNLLFDFPLWLVTVLFRRGVFLNKYKVL
jgi:hypothetical protein